MISISDAVFEIVKQSPYLTEALSDQIVNLSSLARKIHSQVEDKVKKDINDGAIIAALKRISSKLKNKIKKVKILNNLSGMTVRSNITEYTYVNTETLLKKVQALILNIGSKREIFLNLSQGVTESTIIASGNIEKEIQQAFRNETLTVKLENLSSISIKLPQDTVDNPGAYYSILKLFALEGINMVEMISTFTEVSLIFRTNDIDRAFSVLTKATME
ncbi:hypothetical protein A3J20_01525 [Candidatus Gottesmanbacteria bacterium RIFCSPLOWO2_02_FULL_42_29]|uniref:Aspartate kinase n=2 Tax=Candidatus Gottesmaniibacteriota TaxID=1752720 RepID=A0A1F6BF01_9BACT|nr:MAG: hypothetical protein UV09_C0021G0007 [Candidatus Gottesmanbacteria bacterium GW2011_GWA2_42_18]OGG12083.1 MAG: hypothetical protein A2781_03375 [Candidatus Gottesmanbacteria bacterium RIFCSPHIGHO2_01_FULL_42_27]OGG34099.1 MAG: hypothetical protein A3G68_01140 [Candidatus Gottesmanbacteria bacterium RIFCSPLOWO2_12_FULL_42_10]OGG35468.1 MAG: hypothetical protein A2968_00730 [Candidatus Gottesmanbacteria bacterium RIFCSPLOWO2_01_FULL_42_22]OGG38764.1 MAG: hypothetical protein A3J20_01525 [